MRRMIMFFARNSVKQSFENLMAPLIRNQGGLSSDTPLLRAGRIDGRGHRIKACNDSATALNKMIQV